MRAREVFDGNNGDVTKSYYATLNGLGFNGQLAVALFRAQKRSTAAKRYKGRGYTRAAYDVKNWSLSEVCRILTEANGETENLIAWGWKHDPKTPAYEWVLYVELPQGQVSFHSPDRLAGPEYPNEWDGQHNVREKIIQFCDSVMGLTEVVYPEQLETQGASL